MHRRACLTLIGSLAVIAAGVQDLEALRPCSPLDVARGDHEPVEAAGQAARATGQSPPTTSQAEEAIRTAERDRFAAMLKGDVAALDALLADDLSYTHGDGRVVDKAAFLADLRSGDFKYLSIAPSAMKVRVFGDAALVTGAAGMEVMNKGSPARIRIVYTTTHVRREGAWQMVAWHATRIMQ